MLSKIDIAELTNYRDICEIMKLYGNEYSEEDFKVFIEMDKKCYGFYYNGELTAFGCVILHEGLEYITYTWNNGTFTGKKVYLKGYEYIMSVHNRLVYGRKAKTYNKVRRLQNEK